MDKTEFWKHKLMAFLHDPPCKALDFTKVHEEIAMSFVKAALLGEDAQAVYGWLKGLNDSDWFAAEADRISGFGKGAHPKKFGNGSTFKHPLGKAEYEFRSVPTLDRAAEILQDVQKGIQVDSSASPEEQARQNFFFHWRRWMEEAVRSSGGRELAFFPADTRIPDHTIWNHMGVASALQGCRDENKNIRVSFLLFQIGPVQDFIAQARSTRDLWCGSYLLSWLTGTAIKAITDELGPDHLIFPALRAQGVFDALHQELYSNISYGGDSLWKRRYKDGDAESMAQRLLSPTLPNRFFALVPQSREKEFADKARQAIDLELHNISECCWKRFCELTTVENKTHLADMKQRWDRQVDLFVQTAWAAKPLEKISEWQTTFEDVQALLAARRNTRDFAQFVTDKNQRLARKDILSGKEEVIGDEEVWKSLSKTDAFKEEGPYGALSIIKRLWCRTETKGGLLDRLKIDEPTFKKALRMDSLPEIAERNKEKKNPYVAVIAFDGDQIGKRLSGELMLNLQDVVADGLKDCVSGKRKLTPSYHTQFSEALANFATHLAKRVVEKYKGLLVYAGGDDVLCIVPADKALDCASDLRAVFQGDFNVLSDAERNYEFGITQPGFVLADENYPLIVPGPSMDASCGIVIGHCKHPLQALVREAQAAEKRAKNRYAKDSKGDYQGGAFALSLMKRSGEIIEWGGKWDYETVKPIELYRLYTKMDELDEASSRFPYALAELLAPYRLSSEKNRSISVEQLKEIIHKEYEHVRGRQKLSGDSSDQEKLDHLAHNYLFSLDEKSLEDFTSLFLASAFINRQRGEN